MNARVILRLAHADPRSRLARRLFAMSRAHPRIVLLGILWGVAVLVLFGAIFFTRGYPGRDSGLFLYIGQSILDGKIPYRDAWDHKPPGVFYVDALGLWLGGGSIVGVWAVELLSLCTSVWLGVMALEMAFGLGSAFFGSLAWLAGLMLLFTVGGPNLQEEYALPAKFAALWLFLRSESAGYQGPRGFLLGATGAVVVLLRQNLMGVHLAVGLYILLTRIRSRLVGRLLREISWIVAGGGLVIAAVAGYFALNGALDDLLSASITYNLIYTGVSLQSKLDSSVAGFNELARSGLGVIAVASWLVGLVQVAGGHPMPTDARRLLAVGLIAFPLEVVLAGLSGRGYGHYYQAWLPTVAVLAAFFDWRLLRGNSSCNASWPSERVRWRLALAIGMIMMPGYATISGALPLGRPATAVAHAANYVREFTRPNDYVLVWGFEPSINFVSGRRSPSRYVQQYPLLTRGYVTTEMIRQFIADLEQRPPELIIDTSPVNTIVPPIDNGRREGWMRWGPTEFYAPPQEMQELFGYLNAHYRERGPLVQPGQGAVFVYERRPEASAQ